MFLIVALPQFRRVWFAFDVIPGDPRLQGLLGAGMILCSMLNPKGPFQSFFEWPFLTHFGKISYSVYLLHTWPIWIQSTTVKWYKEEGFLFVLAGSFVLGSFIYYTVEVPIQKAAKSLTRKSKLGRA